MMKDGRRRSGGARQQWPTEGRAMTTDVMDSKSKKVLHILRNSWGWSREELEDAKLAACDLIERQAAEIAALKETALTADGAYNGVATLLHQAEIELARLRATISSNYKTQAAEIAALRAAAAPAPITDTGHEIRCEDCSAPYGADGWCDVVVPDAIWNSLGADLLCFRCMTKRIQAAGHDNVPVNVVSGPYSDDNERWRMIGWNQGNAVAVASAVELRMAAARDETIRRREVFASLVTQLDVIHADSTYQSVWFHYQLRYGPYNGPTYVAELAAARAALESAP